MHKAACPPAPPLEALEPMEPSLRMQPFTQAGWIFTLPAGGHRALAEFCAGASRLHSRHHVDITHWFPEVSEALARAPLARTVVDGELCVLDAAGRNDARRLHERALWPGRRPGIDEAVYVVHDLLVHEGQDVRALAWWRRRALLMQLLPGLPGVRAGSAIDAEGQWLYRQALALGCAHMVAQHREAPYRGGRSSGCLLVPCRPPQPQAA